MSDPHSGGSADDELSLEGADPTIVALLAEITDADRLRLEPPPSIWNAIVATIAADRNGSSDHTLTVTDGDDSAGADLSTIERQASTTIVLAAGRRSTDHPTLPPEMGAWRRQWLPLAAAVVLAIVGGLVTWAFSDEITGTESRVPGQQAESDGEVVDVTEITDRGLPGGAAATTRIGEARLVRSGDRYHLDLDLDREVTDLPAVEGYYEVWIADPDLDGMFSLGVLAGDGRYTLPDNLDPADYPIVDVSAEALDGDPTHSGRSVWRGRFDR